MDGKYVCGNLKNKTKIRGARKLAALPVIDIAIQMY
jgi:hypothetical protein